jgi:hypothetical protein
LQNPRRRLGRLEQTPVDQGGSYHALLSDDALKVAADLLELPEEVWREVDLIVQSEELWAKVRCQRGNR